MKRILLLSFCLLISLSTFAFSFTWKRVSMDGSRTGVKAATKDNVVQAIGRVEGNVYYAPNGKVFKGGSIVKVAKVVIDAQPSMADVKTVIAHSTNEMLKSYPESPLSNWFVDNLMHICSQKTGKKVDVGIANFGGIRTNMPKGDVLKDDIMSMFPFKNSLVYVALKGKDLKYILSYMAANGFQPIGGVRCVAKDGKLLSATIKGQPIKDNKIYGIATISFLLNGGDNFFIGKNAIQEIPVNGYLFDNIYEYIQNLTKQGKSIEYSTDGRVKIISKAPLNQDVRQ